MALFLSRFDNKVDRKGRVSVPAQFRLALANEPFAGIVAYPSPAKYETGRPIEACGISRIEQMATGIDTRNPFNQQNRSFATAFLARTRQLPFDSEGRVMLPEPMLALAGIKDVATFAGLGHVFQIWEPSAYEAYEQECFEKAAEEAALLEQAGFGGGGA